MTHNQTKCVVLLTPLVVTSLLAQTQPGTPSTSEAEYFQHILMSLANPDLSTTDLQRRANAFIGQARLDQTQARALEGLAEELRIALTQIRRSVRSLLDNKRGDLTSVDRIRLTELNAQRDRALVQVVDRLKQQIGPEAVARIRSLQWKYR